MQLFIKNKIVSVGGSSYVTDENGNRVYNVKGKVFSLTRKKEIKDLEGNTLFKVRNKLWFFFLRSAYIYNSDGEMIAQIKRKFSLNSNFIINGYKDELRIDGNIIGWNFSILKNDELMGTIKRKFAINDSFVLDIENEQDAAFFVAIVIAIDNIIDAARSDN